jgi:hypothetical protein
MGKSVEGGSAQKSVQGRDYWGIDATRVVAKSRPRTAAFQGFNPLLQMWIMAC